MAMNEQPRPPRTWLTWSALVVLVTLPLALAGYVLLQDPSQDAAPPPEIILPPLPAEAGAEQVRQLCGACHAYPPPDTLPRAAWRKEVKLGYDFLRKDPSLGASFPPLESVALYYEKRAPDALPPLQKQAGPAARPVRFERRGFWPGDMKGHPAVADVQLVYLLDRRRPEVLVCDAGADTVYLLRPEGHEPAWRVLARGYCCARAEVVDLDGDGVKDVLLACLGSFYATDDKVGSVVWLRGAADGTFSPVTLLEGVGRVADVRAADFNGDGRLDLVVAVFGWRTTGETLYLENQTKEWSSPAFAPRVLDARHGASHVSVADLDGDGRPDFVALISQEHEVVVAFLNEGRGKFRARTLYAAPHPTFGLNGMRLVDLDCDGDLDVLLTNGDSLDAPFLLKPYHGVQWLENRGGLRFEPHRLADMYGAGGAAAADLDGDGDLDVVVVSYLPAEHYPQREKLLLDSVVLLEQAAPGRFVRHSLAVGSCDHLACAAGDVDGDGKPDFLVGNHARRDPMAPAVVVWTTLAAEGTAGKKRGLEAVGAASR